MRTSPIQISTLLQIAHAMRNNDDDNFVNRTTGWIRLAVKLLHDVTEFHFAGNHFHHPAKEFS